jgi:WD40 repeat protein
MWVGDREHPQAQLEGWQSRQALIASLALRGDGRFVASGGDDRTAWVWRRDEPTAARLMWQGHDASVNGIALSRDGRVLVAGQGDGTIWTGTVGVADLKAKACKLTAETQRHRVAALYRQYALP